MGSGEGLVGDRETLRLLATTVLVVLLRPPPLCTRGYAEEHVEDILRSQLICIHRPGTLVSTGAPRPNALLACLAVSVVMCALVGIAEDLREVRSGLGGLG